jgi:hypothetical protein
VSLNPTSVAGGSSVTGTVFLSAAAPSGGITVTLATSSSVARAPGVVSVPGGQTSANFTVTTSPVTSSSQVTVTAFYDTTRSATFTVTSGSSQPPAPGTPTLLSPATDAIVSQPVTLDWSDASNAASYDIQVDDSSVFSAPLIRSLTSNGSQTSVTGLANVQHWWRVRARNSAGVARNWSASRRFTPQGTTAPPSSGPLPAPSLITPASDARFSPGQNINFDWSDIAGAVSYTIQIDDNNSFPTRYIVNQTVSASTFSSSALPTRTMWWRARANNSSGAAGAWSSVRRFEVKN